MKSSIQTSLSEIRIGIPYLDDQSYFLNSTDYPYFRDDPENWANRLEKLKFLGHAVVACYIPWRHHEIEINGIHKFDFNGETLGNRDVITFIKLCQEKGLKVIAKPGPFIHAEVNYGGLPNWVCPSFNAAIEPMLDERGKPVFWGGIQRKADGLGLKELPLPAPFDPTFLSEAEHWLSGVTEAVIAPLAYPNGPIVMIQVANEGIYSNYQRAPWAYDYSRSSLRLYAQFLRQVYGNLDLYNQRHGTGWKVWNEIEPPGTWKCPEDLPGFFFYSDWSAYQAYYMREILTRICSWIPVNLPFVINVNPPTAEPFGIDAWLSRINPDDLPGINYGFTNWIGVACKDPSVVERYQIMTKRDRGANHEENWGFSKLYEQEFAHSSVCFYQTLIQIASGATGYNIYTGVGTKHASPDIDQMHEDEYPDCPPINGDGQFMQKAKTVHRLNEFFNRWGSEFLETRPVRPIAFGLYLPYAHSSVWVAEQDWEKAEALGVPNHGQALQQFQRLCLKNHLDFSLINLQAVDVSQYQGYPTLVLASGRWMDRLTQEKLRAYLLGGGRLILIGEIPCMDDDFQPVHILSELQDKAQVITLADFCNWNSIDWRNQVAPLLGIIALNLEARQALVWQYSHPDSNIDYLFVFSGKGVIKPIEFQFHARGKIHTLGLTFPSYSAGVVRIKDGLITSILSKGKNEDLEEEITPSCSLDGETISANKPGDWLYITK